MFHQNLVVMASLPATDGHELKDHWGRPPGTRRRHREKLEKPAEWYPGMGANVGRGLCGCTETAREGRV